MDIQGYPDYKIFPGDDNNTEGYVWSIPRSQKNGRKIGGRFLKFRQTNGYVSVTIRNELGVKKFLVHRLIAITYLENIDNKPIVDHINGTHNDNRLINLRWATNSENTLNTHTGRRGKHTPFDWINIHSKTPTKTYYRYCRGVEGGKWKTSSSIPKLLCYSFFYILKYPPDR